MATSTAARAPVIHFPSMEKPFHQTVRFMHYIRVLLRMLPIPAVLLYWIVQSVAILAFEGSAVPLFLTSMLFFPLALPTYLMVQRYLFGTGFYRGITSAKAETENWRRQWRWTEEQSSLAQEKCKRTKRVFALPNMRFSGLPENDHEAAYHSPLDLLKDIPPSPSFVSYGHVINQQVQAISASNSDEARALADYIIGLLAGRLLCKDLNFVVCQEQGPSSRRVTFVTDVRRNSGDHAIVWLTLQLQTTGRLVTGYVETVRSIYFEKSLSFNGLRYRGDDAKAKGVWWLLGEAFLILSPICFVMAIVSFSKAILDMKDRRYSANFFDRYRPAAGDSVDLFLIGESGTDLYVDPAFVSSVECVRTELVNEVHKTLAAFCLTD